MKSNRTASYHVFCVPQSLSIVLFSLLFLLTLNTTVAQQTFSPRWQSLPWDSGGYDPTSIVWSMVQSNLDLDRDGNKEFLLTTSWSGSYYNTVYLYEAVANDSFQIVWWYSFYPYSSDYSTVAVADLNNNDRQEILCMVDPYDTTYHGFYVFEWDGTDNGFPFVPTATWDFGLGHWFHEGTAMIADDFDNDGREEVAVAFVESWDTYKSKVMIFSSASDTLANSQWQIEFVDSTTMPVVGYALASTDLDKDNRKELVAVGWDTLRVAIYEHTGSPNSYALAANIRNISTYLDLSNDGLVEANFDNNSTNELYMLTANGALFVATNNGDVSGMTASNFNWIGQYDIYNGMAGMTKADLDTNGIPELYLAGSYNETVYRWKYNTGSVTDWNSYEYATVFMDDTTDDQSSSSDQGYVRPSKLCPGDLDSDGNPDILVSSASFATDKPLLLFLESTGKSPYTVNAGWNIVSVPLTVTDPRKINVYPSATSQAFAFTEGGYTQQESLKTGVGYWLKFPHADTISFTGSELLSAELDLLPGWNIIGPMTQDVAVSNVVTVPNGLLASGFYGYDGGYQPADTLLPGKGYWVKTNSAGIIMLQSTTEKHRIVTAGNEKKHNEILERKTFIRGHRSR